MFKFPEVGVKCPFCKVTIRPKALYEKSVDNGWYYACDCTNCGKMFIAEICYDDSCEKYYCKHTYPENVIKKEFSNRILQLSEKFVDIYNQAYAAEAYGLEEIAGMGYRKSLEFLIKDYLIHADPNQADTIRKVPLAQCINERVQNQNIKAVASRSAWLGNDFTHYVPKFEDKDISNMKNFIDAVVYWVNMELITEEALEMEPIK